MNKKSNKKEDTISQLKKEENKTKKNTKKEEEESEEEEEDKNQNVVKEQAAQNADKPKNLKDLMFSMGDNKPKPKKPKQGTKPNKNYENPSKPTFTNSKGTGNAAKIDNELRNRNNPEKKEFKNAKGLNAAAKANEKIKHTKDYLEKDTKKEYKDEPEDVAKPQFKSNLKEGDENFVELNKNEDVSIIHFNFKLLMI